MKAKKTTHDHHGPEGTDSQNGGNVVQFPSEKSAFAEQWQKKVAAGIQYLRENSPRWQVRGVKPVRVEHATLNPLAQAKSNILGHPCELCGALIDTDLTQGELEDLALTVPLRADKELVELLNRLWNQALGLTAA